MTERLFTDEEMKAMSTRTRDLIDAAIDAGDKETAKKLNHRMYAEFLPMHDLYLNWVTGLLSHVYRSHGDKGLHQALSDSCTVWWKPFAEQYAKSSARERTELFAWGLRGHLQPLEITEDDEKITFKMIPCGSGGRLVLSDSYARPQNLAKIEKAQPMSYGREDFPTYCAHCAIMEILSIKWVGAPMVVIIPPDRLGHEPCRFCIYKDPEKIPGEYRRRTGS